MYATVPALYFDALWRIGFGGTTWSCSKAIIRSGALSGFSKSTSVGAFRLRLLSAMSYSTRFADGT